MVFPLEMILFWNVAKMYPVSTYPMGYSNFLDKFTNYADRI